MNQIAPTLDTPAINPTYLRLLCQTLQNLGVDLEPMLKSAGIEPWSELLRREALVTPREANRLIRAALRASGKPELGILLGSAVQISAHSAMGYALAASATLRQALEVLVRYASLRNAAIRFRLIESEQGAAFSLIERVDLEDGHEFITSLIFAAVVLLIESVVGKMVQSAIVDLPFPEPCWRGAIENIFRGQCRFGQRHLTFYLRHELLEQPCMTSDPAAFTQATMECERQLLASLEYGKSTLSQRVREHLIGIERDYPKIADAAQFFNMSSRTLMRRLFAEGTSFQTLLDEARSERARQYLTETSLAIEEIAYRLGYQNTSNFSKTFRRWFGHTPSEFRVKHASKKSG
jgi:AraC-like DNA-binding protein